MSTALHRTGLTRDEFLDWAGEQEGRFEFDGFEPVAMGGGTLDHDQIGQNLIVALRSRLQGSPCRVRGPNAGMATIGDTVRYPDALVACAKVAGAARLVPGVVVVFEVVSPSSGRIDRMVKLREYRAVETIRRYIILEHASIGLTVLSRGDGTGDWIATSLLSGDTLHLPEIGVELPVAELYADVDFSDAP